MKNKKKTGLPNTAGWLLERLISGNVRYSALGDFEEEYSRRLEKNGMIWATLHLWFQILCLFPAFVRTQIRSLGMMFRDTHRVAIRNLRKSKGFSFINLTGLAVGMACTVLIMLWVFDELSYDRFHENSEHIYRVNLKDNRGDPPVFHAWTPNPVGKYLADTYPEVISATKIMFDHFMVSYGDKSFNESRVIFTDPSFFDVFTFSVLNGDPGKLRDSPYSVVISKTLGEKYFGNDDPVGKILKLDTRKDVTVAAVIDVPENTDLKFDLILPFTVVNLYDSERLKEWERNWKALNYQTFIRVHPDTDSRLLDKKIVGVVKKHVPQRDLDLCLQPLARIHLYQPDGSGGDLVYVYIFAVIAVFILVIACVNFMGLATARSEQRSAEVGLRKVAGATRLQLFGRFLYESVLLVLASFLLSLLLVKMALPAFNGLVEKRLVMSLTDYNLLTGMVGVLFFTCIFSGAYPSLFLSSFKTVNLLKQGNHRSAGNSMMRKGIVVVQFSISVFLMIATAVIYSQLNFIRHRDLGLQKEHVVYLLMEGESKERYEAVKTELNKHPGIISSAACFPLPSNIRFWAGFVGWEGNFDQQKVYFAYSFMDHDCIDTLGMKIKEGRAFSKELDGKSSRFIVNEEAARQMGGGSPVGKEMNFWGRRGQIVGVVRNFHFHHMSRPIAPLVIVSGEEWKKRYLVLRVKPGETAAAIAHFRKVWHRVNPGFSFEYGFLDENFENIYSSETRLSAIFNSFALLAIMISCLGLFGLASFVAERRAKEVGIRKVLGSSVKGIVGLMTRDFLKLVGVANLIAWPVALYFMSRWLKSFAYHADIKIWIFVASGFLAAVIATLTVGYQALRSSHTNPVDVLKCE